MPSPTPARDPATDADESRNRPRVARGERLAPLELAEWLEERLDSLADRWVGTIRERSAGRTGLLEGVSARFTQLLVGFLPWMLGPYRETIEPLWIRASELFGQVAARRGLAAGEVIEEFQVLRELVIRDLYRDPPMGGRLPLSLREVLRLNRGIDRGVTHASVGHTDALFFQFFESETAFGGLDDELVDEVEEQLAVLEQEMQAIIGHARSAEWTE